MLQGTVLHAVAFLQIHGLIHTAETVSEGQTVLAGLHTGLADPTIFIKPIAASELTGKVMQFISRNTACAFDSSISCIQVA